jgi:hypothetical protein
MRNGVRALACAVVDVVLDTVVVVVLGSASLSIAGSSRVPLGASPPDAQGAAARNVARPGGGRNGPGRRSRRPVRRNPEDRGRIGCAGATLQEVGLTS